MHRWASDEGRGPLVHHARDSAPSRARTPIKGNGWDFPRGNRPSIREPLPIMRLAKRGLIHKLKEGIPVVPTGAPKARSGATVLCSGGARLPLSTVADHCVESNEKLAHASHETDLSGLGGETLGKGLDGRVSAG